MKSIQQLKKDLSGLNDQAVADPEEFQGFAQRRVVVGLQAKVCAQITG